MKIIKIKLAPYIVVFIFCAILISCSLYFDQENVFGVEKWNVIAKKYEDINKDGKKEEISVLFTNDFNSIPKMQIKINKSVRMFEFNPMKAFAPISVNVKQFVKLADGRKGILINLNSEAESSVKGNNNPIYFYDHSFIIVNYDKGKINVVLNGMDLPFNKRNNYKVRYVPDYKIMFFDKATKFTLKYSVPEYKQTSDGLKRLKLLNNNEESFISNNYFEVNAQDVNHDGVDEILCSKFIPGLYHADVLGIIQYSFQYKKGSYLLTSEALKYDGKTLATKVITIH